MSWKIEDIDKAQTLLTQLTTAISKQQKILEGLIDDANKFADYLLLEVKKARDNHDA